MYQHFHLRAGGNCELATQELKWFKPLETKKNEPCCVFKANKVRSSPCQQICLKFPPVCLTRLWVSLSRGWLIHSDSHYSHRGRVNHLPSAKLEASLSPPISFFPTWALSDGLPDCTHTHNWALLRNQGHKSQNNKEKKNYLENNFTDILWTVTFSVPALKGEFNLFSFVHIQFFDFWVESITPPRSFD